MASQIHRALRPDTAAPTWHGAERILPAALLGASMLADALGL
jgi:hypothetical protein